MKKDNDTDTVGVVYCIQDKVIYICECSANIFVKNELT